MILIPMSNFEYFLIKKFYLISMILHSYHLQVNIFFSMYYTIYIKLIHLYYLNIFREGGCFIFEILVKLNIYQSKYLLFDLSISNLEDFLIFLFIDSLIIDYFLLIFLRIPNHVHLHDLYLFLHPFYYFISHKVFFIFGSMSINIWSLSQYHFYLVISAKHLRIVLLFVTYIPNEIHLLFSNTNLALNFRDIIISTKTNDNHELFLVMNYYLQILEILHKNIFIYHTMMLIFFLHHYHLSYYLVIFIFIIEIFLLIQNLSTMFHQKQE